MRLGQHRRAPTRNRERGRHALTALFATATAIALLARALPTAAATPNEWTAFSGVVPGTTIAQRLLDGRGLVRCTLAFIARDNTTYSKKGITAGHCDRTADGQPTVIHSESSNPDKARPLGTYSRSIDRGAATGTSSVGLPSYTDAGIIDLTSSAPILSYRVAAHYRIDNVLPTEPPLPTNTEVCKFGARTGETCGPVVYAGPEQLHVRMHLIPGDSGSPVYIKTAPTTITAVGILSGHLSHDPGVARAYYLRPIIDGLNLKICGDC
ncbi:hypothetical protein ACNUDN_30475 [Mycobacterium sp. smrl_JER01]|uniref:hypothetical protein n=1 Tax=Mycobacterium sp. smrl_JER01 TaxID=3402633 RepID=UPI003AD633BF